MPPQVGTVEPTAPHVDIVLASLAQVVLDHGRGQAEAASYDVIGLARAIPILDQSGAQFGNRALLLLTHICTVSASSWTTRHSRHSEGWRARRTIAGPSRL